MINFVAKAQGCKNGEAAKIIDRKLNLGLWNECNRKKSTKVLITDKRRVIDTHSMTQIDAEKIARCIGIKGTETIWRLHQLDILFVGNCIINNDRGGFQINDCWFLIDEETKAATARRTSGEYIGTTKSLCPKGYHKRPIGLGTSKGGNYKRAIIAEGEKDLIAIAHGLDDISETMLICMPSTQTSLHGYSLPSSIETVEIFAQADRSGIEAAMRWAGWAWFEDLPQITDFGRTVKVCVPSRQGYDWADLMRGKTKEAAAAFLLGGNFKQFVDIEIESICPEQYSEEVSHKRPARQPGSPPNLKRDKLVTEAQRKLLPHNRNSPAAICKAMGIEVA